MRYLDMGVYQKKCCHKFKVMKIGIGKNQKDKNTRFSQKT